MQSTYCKFNDPKMDLNKILIFIIRHIGVLNMFTEYNMNEI